MPIMDNFESQFINNATETSNGLMSNYDKTKLDGIVLDDIDYITEGLEEIKEYMVPQFIYGIKIDPTNPDPNLAVEYTDDSVGFIPLTVDQTTGVCNTTDIETGSLGQVMIRFKHLYYKFSVDENKIWFQVSNKQNDSTWVDTAFATEDGIGTVRKDMYIAAYESIQENNILQSLSNKLPSFNLSFEEVESLSEFGVFHMINIVKKQFIIFLGYLVTRSINLEGTIGNGNIEGELLKTGTMNDKGLFYEKKKKNEGVKLFGVENLWGNQLKAMHGIIQKLVYILDEEQGITIPEQHLYIKEFYPYNNIENFDDVGKIDPNTNGFISSIKFLSDSIYVPDELTGSSTTYFKSYFQNGESVDANNRLYGIYGGSNAYSDKAGSEFLLLAYTNKDDTQITTHIVY